MLIDGFRLTGIWTETVLDPLTGQVDPTTLPAPHVVIPSAYREHWRQGAPTPLTKPWPATAGRHLFWEWYLGGRPEELAPRKAERRLVPLRVSLDSPFAPPSDAWRHSTEGFAYPWGPALAITAYSRAEGQSLADTARAALEAHERIDGAGAAALADLRRKVFGDAPGRASEPFWIFTPIAATAETGDSAAPDAPAVHRLLHASTSFDPHWDTTHPLPPLDQVRIAGRQFEADGRFTFGRRRARALWSPPDLLDPPGPAKHTLGCRHRNLTLATVHAESIGRFLAATATTQGSLRTNHDYFAKLAVGVVRAIKAGGRESNYRSMSVVKQIDDESWPAVAEALVPRLSGAL